MYPSDSEGLRQWLEAEFAAVQAARRRTARQVRQQRPTPAGEYLTISETATLLGIATKTVRNKMASGAFQEGVHWFRPPRGRPRFKRSALVQGEPEATKTPPTAGEGRAFAGLRVDHHRRRA
jgi:hypothetical protein